MCGLGAVPHHHILDPVTAAGGRIQSSLPSPDKAPEGRSLQQWQRIRPAVCEWLPPARAGRKGMPGVGGSKRLDGSWHLVTRGTSREGAYLAQHCYMFCHMLHSSGKEEGQLSWKWAGAIHRWRKSLRDRPADSPGR